MYYPRQIPQLLNEAYGKHLTYCEYQIKELQEYVMCIWHITSKKELTAPISNTVLPDGCIDLIMDLNRQTMYFSGFSKNTETVTLAGNVNLMGVRFKPGAIYSLFHINGDKVMDEMVEFSQIERHRDLSAIYRETDVSGQIGMVTDYLLTKIPGAKDTHYIQLVDSIYQKPTNQYVRDIGGVLGYESRQLQRVFLQHYGVSPKVLLNILRLHKCMELLFDRNHSLQQAALDSGFYDQAHFIREMKRYTGIQPTLLLKKYKQ